MSRHFLLTLLLASTALFAQPTVTTVTATGITSSGAQSGGTVSGSSITAEGIVYSTTNTTPTVGGSGVTATIDSLTSPFVSYIGCGNGPCTSGGVGASTLVYYRGYATGTGGTGYDATVHTFTTAAGVYTLPVDSSDCPQYCRTIPWLAGSDVWNSGTLPAYPVGTTCSGLTEGLQTTIDNTSALQTCLNSLSSSHAAQLPAGIYYMNGTLTMASSTVLRGAGGGPGSQGRWLNGADSTDTWDNPGGSSGYWGDTLATSSPAASTTTLYMGVSGNIFSGYGGDIGTLLAMTGGYTYGSTAVTAATNPSSVSISTGTWVFIAEQSDTGLPVDQNSACSYCGLPSPNEGTYFMSQIAQVTSITGSGPYTINLSRPLYYTFKSAFSPVIAAMTSSNTHQGIENLILAGVAGTNSSRYSPNINWQGMIESWVKNVQIYNVSFNNNEYGIMCQYCYGNEFRDGYIHFGGGSGGNGGGSNYCFGLLGSNSDNKIENNICREDRHALILEGGGSGDAFLYNYTDDMYDASDVGSTDTFINNARGTHGAHPYMILWEGNVGAPFHADYVHGSSSHGVLFRNWLWADSTGNRFNWTADGAAGSLWGYVGIQIDYQQHYYSLVGNVVGHVTLPGSYHANWSGGTVAPACNGGYTATTPSAFVIGCDVNGAVTQNPTSAVDTLGRSTTLLHGNYDPITAGVANWDGGANHAMGASMYYTSKPAFLSGCSWPLEGPDVTGVTNSIPAIIRYAGSGVCSNGIIPSFLKGVFGGTMH